MPLPEEPFALAARLVPRLMAGLALFFILTRAALSARRLLGEIDWELCLEEFAHLAGSTLLACGVVLFCAGVAEALLRNMCVRRALFLSPAEARREGRPSARRSLGEDSKGRTR